MARLFAIYHVDTKAPYAWTANPQIKLLVEKSTIIETFNNLELRWARDYLIFWTSFSMFVMSHIVGKLQVATAIVGYIFNVCYESYCSIWLPIISISSPLLAVGLEANNQSSCSNYPWINAVVFESPCFLWLKWQEVCWLK